MCEKLRVIQTTTTTKQVAHQLPFFVSKGLVLLLHRHSQVVQLELELFDNQLLGCRSILLLLMTLEPPKKRKFRSS